MRRPVEDKALASSGAKADREPRCWHCRHKLGEQLTRPWRLRCPQCRALNASTPG